MDVSVLLIGEGECTYKKIVDIFLMDSVSSKTSSEWRTFARELKVKEHDIQKLAQEKIVGQKSIHDVLVGVLTEWRSSNGKTATLESLVAHLQAINWNATAEELLHAFQITSTDPKSYSTGLPDDKIPPELTYYVKRRLLANNRISIRALTSNFDSEDTFVFIGILYADLKVLVNHKLARSSEIISKNRIDIRYVLLEQNDDWEKLCEKYEGSVHLLQFENENLICLRSHGNMANFRKVLETKGKNKAFGEEGFLKVVNEMGNQNMNIPICIADSPGMGKSVLLAEIGRHLKNTCTDRVVVFIVTSKFIESIKQANEGDAVTTTLINTLTSDNNLREKLKLDFDSNGKSVATNYEFLFDGFDEIQKQDFKLGFKSLKELVECLHHCARLWVTTRLHLIQDLENCLGVYGYRIQPFHDEDKLNFLTNYWSLKDEDAATNSRRLNEFGKSCLSAIEPKLSDRERDILGIPLLCKLLAEVYETKAIVFCGSSDKDDEHVVKGQRSHFEIKSITALYEGFIVNRIQKGLGINESNQKILETYREEINRQKDVYASLSIKLIFPKKLKVVLSRKQIGDYKYEKRGDQLLKIGIVEAIKKKAEPRFLHRSVAEFFVAKFLVDRIPEKSFGEISHFFYEVSSSGYYPNIRNFIDCLLKQNPEKYNLKLDITFSSLNVTGTLSNALKSLVKSDLVNIFKFFHVVFDEELSSKPLHPVLILIQKAVKYSSVEMINFICEYYDYLSNVSNLDPETHLLNQSIQRGDIDMFTYLLNDHGYYDVLYRSKLTKLRECLQACLDNTAFINEETRLQERLHIIFGKLINIDPNNFRQSGVGVFCRRLKFSEINTKLLIDLLRHGIELVQEDFFGDRLYLVVISRTDESMNCFLQAFAESTWRSTMRLTICQQNVLLRYIESHVSLRDLKDIPLLCILLSEVEARVEQTVDNENFMFQKRYKAKHIVTVYERLMLQLSIRDNSDNQKSNLNMLQILLAFKLLGLNLPSEFESDLTAIFLNDKNFNEVYKSLVANLKQCTNTPNKLTNINVVAQCLVAEYIMSLVSCTPALTFLFETLFSVSSTKSYVHSEGKYFKEFKFVHNGLCRVLDKLLGQIPELTLPSSFQLEFKLFDILAASVYPNFKNIFSFSLYILRSTLRSTAEANSNVNGLVAPLPLDCFELIHRAQRHVLEKIWLLVWVKTFDELLLLIAIQEESVDHNMLKRIFASGVNINSQDEKGSTVLSYAVREERYEICNILVRLRANFGTEYYEGQNLLHHAARVQEFDLVNTIIQLRALYINEPDIDGNTALHIALMQTNQTDDLSHIVKILLHAGAEWNIENKNRMTPISLAIARNDVVGDDVIDWNKFMQ